MTTLRSFARHLGAASLAGAIAGVLVGGLLGRVAMRVAGATTRPELAGSLTSNGNRVGEITFQGTLALILFVGVFSGIVGGVAFAVAEPWLRSRRWKGLIFGAALLVAVGFTVLDPTNIDFERFGITLLNVALFAALFIAFGVITAWLFERISTAIDRPGPFATGLTIICWLSALVAVAAAVLSAVSSGGLGEPGPALFLAVAVVVPPVVLWRHLPRQIAYAAFAAPVVVGGLRTVDGLRQLLD